MASTFTLARRLRAGETIFAGWSNLPSPIACEVMARDGFPAIVIDMQHGLWDVKEVIEAIGAVRHGGGIPIVRPPLNDVAMASRALDFGAEGIIAPMINTVADAKALVSAAKYPPLGDRSWGPHRALMFAGVGADEHLRDANSETLTLAMIETRTALENVDAIAAVDGIDALFVGPSDLSIALANGKSLNQMSPEVEAALDRICAAAVKAGKIPGVFTAGAERAVALAKRGYRFVSAGGDLGFLHAGVQAQMRVIKAG
jgi:4-hydroxy-2-oxoheptanedioate aldolase